MSTTSPQAEAAGAQSQWQANLASQLAGQVMPELTSLLGKNGISGLLQSTQGGQLPSAMDQKAYASALGTLNQAYGQQGMVNREQIDYNALRAGEATRSPGAVQSALTSAATSLDRDRQAAQRNLDFASASASLQDYNQLLSLMGQGTQTALGLAQGFGGAANAAIGGLSQNSQLGSFLGGAASGASLGFTVGGPYGALIGGVVGGGAGLFGGG